MVSDNKQEETALESFLKLNRLIIMILFCIISMLMLKS